MKKGKETFPNLSGWLHVIKLLRCAKLEEAEAKEEVEGGKEEKEIFPDLHELRRKKGRVSAAAASGSVGRSGCCCFCLPGSEAAGLILCGGA